MGGHEAYRNNNLEEHFGNEHRMLLSFLKSRRKTGNGVNHAVGSTRRCERRRRMQFRHYTGADRSGREP